jgi:carbonic anhydrase
MSRRTRVIRQIKILLVLLLALPALAQDEPVLADPTPATESEGMSVIMKPKETAAKKKTAKKKAQAKKKTEAPAAEPSRERNTETSMRYLVNGNSRFVKKNFRADGRDPKDRERGMHGELPHSAVLASSDSRVVPEIIFDQGLGELYTVRVLGENIDAGVLASLEYAVETLNVPLLVVLGNSDCAAMQMQQIKNEDELSPSMKELAESIRPRLKTLKSDEPSPSYEIEATLNADAVARELVRRSAIIRSRVENQKLTIKSGLYRINTGRITFY